MFNHDKDKNDHGVGTGGSKGDIENDEANNSAMFAQNLMN